METPSTETVESSSDNSSTKASVHKDEIGGDFYTFDQGSFILTDSWDKYDPQSTDAKPFFVPEDYDGVGIPDNISVEYGDFGPAIATDRWKSDGGHNRRRNYL